MGKTIKDLGILVVITFSISLFIWLPHLLKLPNFYGLNYSNGFSTIYRNYDGAEYIIVAKSFYDSKSIAALPQNKAPLYYASHFPGYPLLILLFSPIVGFLKSMLFVSLIFTIFSAWIFYLLVKEFHLTDQPLWLSILFLFLPARWLIVHTVGSPEPIFICFTISTIYFLLKYERSKKMSFIFLATFSGLFAQITRSPGILLFIGLFLYVVWKMFQQAKQAGIKKAFLNHLGYMPLILIPLGLLSVFVLYGLTYHDFFAYFHSGDNIHLTFPPFQVFNKSQYWVGDIWLEDIIYIFIVGFLGGLLLLKQKLYPLGFFVLVYLGASLLVVHRDISRYVLPVMPFVLISFEKVLKMKEFKIVFVIILLGIYLYAQNFILHNTAPIPNLELIN